MPDAAPPGASASPKVVVVDAGVDPASGKRYVQALADGRRATQAKKWAEARVAFDRALAERKDDPRALAERGYAYLLAGDLEAASADLERALRSGTLDRKLEAAVQFNRGLVLEKQGKGDEAIAAFAVADALESTPARRAKLAGRAACVAASAAEPFEAKRYADFRALADAVSPTVDRGDPKKSVCIESHNAEGTPDADAVCDRPWPWALFHNHHMFTEDEWVAWPAGGALYAVEVGRIGAWPAHCTNMPATEASRDHGLVRLHTAYDGEAAGIDEKTTPSDDGMLTCTNAVPWTQDQWLDPKTGRTLLALRVFQGAPVPAVEVKDDAIVVRGAGCDRSVTR